MKLLYVLLVIIGFLPFIVTLFKIRRAEYMRRTGIKTTATVKQIYGSSIKGMNRVLIEFRLETGQLMSQEIIVAGLPYNEGDKLPLIYEKNNPAKNILEPGKNYIFIIVFTLLIAAFVIFAALKIKEGIETGNFE